MERPSVYKFVSSRIEQLNLFFNPMIGHLILLLEVQKTDRN
jgi:hypothetical protein